MTCGAPTPAFAPSDARRLKISPAVRFVFLAHIPLEWTGLSNCNGRTLYRLAADVRIWIQTADGEMHLFTTIKAGFLTDGLSIPRWAAWWQDPWGPGWQAALLHDWLLHLLEQGLIAGPKIVVDLTFLTALIGLGVSFPRAGLMFLAVRTRRFRGPADHISISAA